MSVTLSPDTLTGNYASSNSPSPFEDHNAYNLPPLLPIGEHNSRPTDNLVTAIPVTTSYDYM
ncbi:hypothetical protein JMUB7499_27040 [Staphylococcus aureus]